jgi:hypothetical protein
LDIAGDELLLVDALGYNAGHYYYYNGVKNAYLPVADEIVSSVYATLKTNLLVMSKVTAFIQLEILKNDINHDLTSVDPTLSFPVIVQDVHNRIDHIASELRSCSFQTRY